MGVFHRPAGCPQAPADGRLSRPDRPNLPSTGVAAAPGDGRRQMATGDPDSARALRPLRGSPCPAGAPCSGPAWSPRCSAWPPPSCTPPPAARRPPAAAGASAGDRGPRRHRSTGRSPAPPRAQPRPGSTPTAWRRYRCPAARSGCRSGWPSRPRWRWSAPEPGSICSRRRRAGRAAEAALLAPRALVLDVLGAGATDGSVRSLSGAPPRPGATRGRAARGEPLRDRRPRSDRAHRPQSDGREPARQDGDAGSVPVRGAFGEQPVVVAAGPLAPATVGVVGGLLGQHHEVFAQVDGAVVVAARALRAGVLGAHERQD